MSTYVDLTGDEHPFRISLCSSGACFPHLEFVRDGNCVEIFEVDVAVVREAMDELERFVGGSVRAEAARKADERLRELEWAATYVKSHKPRRGCRCGGSCAECREWRDQSAKIGPDAVLELIKMVR